METRQLGPLTVSALGYGAMGLSHAYGAPTEHREAVRVLNAAVDAGYSLVDTAEVYGTPQEPHHNESLVGAALASRREEVQIATKFGLGFDTSSGRTPYPLVPDARPGTIRASIDGSLQRLGTDHVDLWFQHRQDPQVPVEEVAGVVGELITEGKVLHWGLSEVDEDTIRRAHAVTPLAAVENRYSMMARGHEALFGVLEELGIGFVAFSPMANGFLTGAFRRGTGFDADSGDYRAAMPQFTAAAVAANAELLGLLDRVAAEHDATPGQVSLAWMLCKRPWIVPIPGSRRIDRLEENAGAVRVSLDTAEVADLDAALDRMGMSDVFGVRS